MEIEYGDDATRDLHLYERGLGKGFDRQAFKRLARLAAATNVHDLAALPGNRLKKLKGDRAGQWSMRINDQWRITFSVVENRAVNVKIEDYH